MSEEQKTKRIFMGVVEILLVLIACLFSGVFGYKLYQQKDFDYIPHLGEVVLLEPFSIDLFDNESIYLSPYPLVFILALDISVEGPYHSPLLVYDGYTLFFKIVDIEMNNLNGEFNVTYFVIISLDGFTILYNNTFYEELVFENVINPNIFPIYFYRLVIK
jgi:hypothetical protein